jgi:hypothetical protein
MLMHFRKPLGLWAREHLRSQRLQRTFTRVLPEGEPALFMLMMLQTAAESTDRTESKQCEALQSVHEYYWLAPSY